MAETVLVRYFAAAEEATGRAEEQIALDEPTLGALRVELLARRAPNVGSSSTICSSARPVASSAAAK